MLTVIIEIEHPSGSIRVQRESRWAASGGNTGEQLQRMADSAVAEATAAADAKPAKAKEPYVALCSCGRRPSCTFPEGELQCPNIEPGDL